ncbi:MAG: GspH/FimT family pseudopilin [Pseudomonadota bacterium]
MHAPPRHPSRRAAVGFTLIELLVTIGLIALLLRLAVPMFTDAALSNKVTSYANSFIGAVQTAKSEAIKRNATVQICRRARATEPSGTPSCASAGTWQNGWFVWVDANGDSAMATDEILLEQKPFGTDVTFCTGTESTGVCNTAAADYALNFLPGVIGSATKDIILCKETGKAKRVLQLAAGRVAVKRYPAITNTPATTSTCP